MINSGDRGSQLGILTIRLKTHVGNNQTRNGETVRSTLYNQDFYDGQASGSAASAARILPVVNSIVKPGSVLDLGCGLGTWLAEWTKLGVNDLVGVDGDYVDPTALRIPESQFLSRDLTDHLDLERKFDLVMSLEVAEHLESRYAPIFVANLVRHGEVVLFSAAIPGQGGAGHINEQWPTYWATLFAQHGLRPYGGLRANFWLDEAIAPWYRQNCMFFATEQTADVLRLPDADNPLDIIHPQLEHSNIPLRKAVVTRLLSSPVGPSLKKARGILRRMRG
jgi:SAM-dependent methyltransferase